MRSSAPPSFATRRRTVSPRACPAEKSGQAEFDFEYGDDFVEHIEQFHPTFCKVLVRYKPEGDQALNRRQAARLRRLSDYLHGKSRSRSCSKLFLCRREAHIQRLGGDKKAYDLELRPRLMVGAIRELQDGGVEPDVWKIEGLDRREDCEHIVAAAQPRRPGPRRLNHPRPGEDERRCGEW